MRIAAAATSDATFSGTHAEGGSDADPEVAELS